MDGESVNVGGSTLSCVGRSLEYRCISFQGFRHVIAGSWQYYQQLIKDYLMAAGKFAVASGVISPPNNVEIT